MKMITRRGIFLWILSALFIVGLTIMTVSLMKNGDQWVMKRYNLHVYSDGELIGAGTVYDCDDNVLAETVDGERVYSENELTRMSTLHIVGDPMNFISSGVQEVYAPTLTGYNPLTGIYNLKKYGKGNDVKLTIDSDICNAAYEALDGRKGTIGIVNYETGDILCAVSTPTYDVNDVPDDINTSDDYEGVYINRLFSAEYVPGSTFKIVTAICAIENMPDVYDRTWDCNGEFLPSHGIAIECHSDHGENVDFYEALACSCNAVFAQIAIELGDDALAETAKRLGIGSSVEISGAFDTFVGKFNVKGVADDKLGWTGIGQGDTRIAPITMLRIVSAIARGGDIVSFNLVNDLFDQAGEALNITIPRKKTKLMSSDVADAIGDMLRNNVVEQYGDYNYEGLSLCAKSGTAQIDEYDEHNIAWFTGYMDDPDYPYAFVVVIENGNSGSQVAGPVANEVLQAVVDKY